MKAMNNEEILNSFEELNNHYMETLAGYTLEELRRKPAADEWSLGQMYAHLIQSARHMQLGNAMKLMSPDASGQGPAGTTGKSTLGEMIYASGAFPPQRVHVPPSPQYTPQQPESHEQLREGLEAVSGLMKEVMALLPESDDQRTVEHPRFGGLNAREWFALVEMHYRHHLLQEERLVQFLGNRD